MTVAAMSISNFETDSDPRSYSAVYQVISSRSRGIHG
jgi:hypothetical protein